VATDLARPQSLRAPDSTNKNNVYLKKARERQSLRWKPVADPSSGDGLARIQATAFTLTPETCRSCDEPLLKRDDSEN
jgi:hypothetical protein